LGYFLACYVVYTSLLVLFLYIYVSVDERDRPVINALTQHTVLQMPG